MFKNILFFTILLFTLFSCKSKQSIQSTITSSNYGYTVDLLHCENDRINVQLTVPPLAQSQLLFIIPKIVPGIYGAMDFGQYISQFKALDKNNKPLPVTKIDVNTCKIEQANQLQTIHYQVDDTWDDMNYRNGFYRSAGSSYEANEVFILNYNTFIGYFEGFEKLPYEVQFIKPKGFYGASYLAPMPISDTLEQVKTSNYNELVDAPLLYAKPDTAWLQVGNAKVLVALNTKPKEQYAKPLAKYIETILNYQKNYLGGTMPVDKYVFLIYHSKNDNPNEFIGDGLEHARSTICLYNSFDLKQLDGMIGDVASHEFFHILTPLNIHSEEIEFYNFKNPTLSQHLWLYEGLTEYFTIHAPIWEKYYSIDDFFKKIEYKMRESQGFDTNVSLTEMSKKAMERQDQYYNFYLKGTLFNLCLDIELRELSNGRIGMKDVTQQLMAKYGAKRPFKDDELFDTISAMTFPSVRDFFKKYVEGIEPLPLKTQLQKVGIEINKGKLKLTANPTETQLKLRKYWINQ